MAKAHANSWEVTDEFWKRVEPLVPQSSRDPSKHYKRAAGAGRPSKPPRLVFEAILYVLRTGCQWKALPAERFGSASAIHQKFLLWSKAGFLENLWKAGLAEYDDCEGIAWRWQSIDEAMFKAPLAQAAVGRNPTDREKKGSKRHLLVDGRGVPLSLVVTGANAHDVTQLEAVLSSCVIKRPAPRQRRSKHLCADAGYRGQNALKVILAHGYIVIVRPAPFLRDLRVVARMPAEQVHACGMVCTNRRWCTPWRDRRARSSAAFAGNTIGNSSSTWWS